MSGADAPSRGRRRAAEEEESYFVSMADMMVGLVFVFVILLLYFALQFQQRAHAIIDAGETRAQILSQLSREVERRDPALRITVDTRTGVLRLPASVLFASNSFELSPGGIAAVRTIAGAMAAVLPCYSFRPGARHTGCPAAAHSIDAVFVEGHTDADPLAASGPVHDNLDLSALRATATFRALIGAAPVLGTLHNLPAGDPATSPILSVSGYGADRPIPGSTDDPAGKAANRRIDLRFLMETPNAEAMTALAAT